MYFKWQYYDPKVNISEQEKTLVIKKLHIAILFERTTFQLTQRKDTIIYLKIFDTTNNTVSSILFWNVEWMDTSTSHLENSLQNK